MKKRVWLRRAAGVLLAHVSIIGLLHASAPSAAENPVVARLDELLQGTVTQANLASLTIQVRKQGQILFSSSAGYADLEQNVRATPDSAYAIGSITKSMTAYCILTLVAQGKLQLTSRLADLLPDYEGAGGEATVLQLLTHTSGIVDYAGDSAPDRITDPAKHYSEGDVVALFAHDPLVFTPGTRWQYSNSGYYLLGLIIQKVTGRPYEQAVQDLLISPFELHDIAMDYRTPLRERRVRGYTHGESGAFQNASSYDATIALSAGGYRATVSDLTSYIERLFSDRVPRAVHDMMFAQTPLSDGTAISYRPIALVHGSLQGHERYSHAGGIWGFQAHVSYFPADQLAIGLLTNTDNGALSIADLDLQIARIVLELPAQRLADLPITAAEARTYVGTYCLRQLLKGVGDITISYAAPTLVLTVGDSTQGVPLRYQGHGRFVMAGNDDAVVRLSIGKHSMATLQMDTATFGTLSAVRCRK